MRFYFFYILLTTGLVTSSCSRKNIAVEGDEPEPELLVEMEKTPCYGDCPVYIFSLYSNGVAKLDARDNLPWIGKYRAKIGKWQMNRFLKSFKEVDFFDFRDSYETMASDLPTTYLYYSNGEKSKKIKDYDGAPEDLKELEKTIEEFVNDLNWKRSVVDL